MGQVAVHALGGLSVSRGGDSLDGPWLEQRPGELLALLVAERERVLAAEEIAEALWPGRGVAAIGTVHHLVSVLRDRLDPRRVRGDAGRVVDTVGRGYRLGESVAVDADRFALHAVVGLRAWREARLRRALTELAAADALYRGRFLGDREGPWSVLLERERLRGLAADVWRASIAIARARDDWPALARHRARLVAEEPYDQDTQDWLGPRPRRPSGISSRANGELTGGS